MRQISQQIRIYMEGYMKQYLKQQGFTIHNQVGYGLTSKVFYVSHENGRQYALKYISCKHEKPEKIRLQAKLEDILLRDLSHPGVIRCHQVRQTEDEICLLLEYCCEGSMNFLDKLLQKEQTVKEKKGEIVTYYLAQMTNILLFLKKMGLVHRDIKLENFVLTKHQKLKLVDFGTAQIILSDNTIFDAECINISKTLNEGSNLVGSRHYFAPELIGPKQHRKVTFALDVWCLGILAYKLFCGQFPFETSKKGTSELFNKIRDEEPFYPDFLTQNEKQFLEKCFKKNPDERIKAEEIPDLPLFSHLKIEQIFSEPSPLDMILNPAKYEQKELKTLNCKLKEGEEGKFKDGSISLRRNKKGKIHVIFSKGNQRKQILLENIHIQKPKKDILKIQTEENFYIKFADTEKRDVFMDLIIQNYNK